MGAMKMSGPAKKFPIGVARHVDFAVMKYSFPFDIRQNSYRNITNTYILVIKI